MIWLSFHVMWSPESFYIELELFPVRREDRTLRRAVVDNSIEMKQGYFFEKNQTYIRYCFSSRNKFGEAFAILSASAF